MERDDRMTIIPSLNVPVLGGILGRIPESPVVSQDLFWKLQARCYGSPATGERRNERSDNYELIFGTPAQKIPQQHLERTFEEMRLYAGAREWPGGGLGLAAAWRAVRVYANCRCAHHTEHGSRYPLVDPARLMQGGVIDLKQPQPILAGAA